jgi:hypothetical protein
MDYQKINKLQNNIKTLKAKANTEEDSKKKRILKLKRQIEELKIQIERLK